MDYEALGRYTEATEKVERMNQEKQRLAKVLTALVTQVEGIHGSSCLDVYEWSGEKVGRLVAEIEELRRKIREVAEEANTYADRAQRPKFSFRTMP